jgi:hypothetical protein
MIEITSVKASHGFELVVGFNTGETRRFDMRPYLGYPVYRRLGNPVFFSLAKVAYGTVTWPDGIDIAPETVYHEGIPS